MGEAIIDSAAAEGRAAYERCVEQTDLWKLRIRAGLYIMQVYSGVPDKPSPEHVLADKIKDVYKESTHLFAEDLIFLAQPEAASIREAMYTVDDDSFKLLWKAAGLPFASAE